MQEITISSQIKKGVLEYAILLIISRGQVYASDILQELKKADLLVAEGTLYPLLSRLRSSDLLQYTWVESPSGPPRKYYTLTSAGTEFLATLGKSWDQLTHSIQILTKPYESDR